MKSYIEHIMIGGKSILRLGFVLCSIFLLSHQDAGATHIVGGDITYKCLGGNRYEIRLTVRRDCFNGAPNAQFDDPASIGLYDLMTNNLIDTIVGAPGGQYLLPYNADDTLNQILISDCTVVSGDVCVHTTTYVMTIFLPYRPSGYVLAYQRCCRNATLTNVEDPLDAGMTLTTELSGPAQLECNSAPRFGDYPPVYICVNQPIEFNHAAFDMEGDSLVYELCVPYAGGDRNLNKPQPPPEPPYDPIVYKAPYSLANILGGTPLHIDPATGALTGTPNTIGQFVVGICVKAYKNGILTGTSRRDFQYNVRMCRDRPLADFSAPDLQCESRTVNFTSTSVFADHFLWIYDYGNPDSDTSELENPTYTYPADGFYNVALIVHDSMSVCYDTIIQQIGVFTSLLNAEFTASVSECTDGIEIQVTDQSSDPEYAIDKWEWVLTTSEGHFQASTDTNPTFNFDIENPATVLIVLIVTDENGCTATQVHSFPVQEFDIVFNAEADSICKGDMVPLVINGDPNLTYIWSPPNGLDLTEPWNPKAFPGISTCYYVTVTDDICTIIDSICVNVQQLPNLGFSYETDCKSLTVEFTNLSTNGEKYFWDFGDVSVSTDTSSVSSPTYTYSQPGLYTVTLSSRDGCDVSITQIITANTISEQLEDQLINCFEDEISLNPDFNPAYTYVWSPAAFLDNASSPNPSATVLDDTWFYVTISQASLPECEIVDSVLVIIPDFFDISAPDDIIKCDLAKVELIATLTGFGGVVVTWKDLEGEVIGFGTSISVSPVNTTSYVVMAMDSLGCMQSDTVTVSKPDPTFTVVTNNDTSYCDIQTIILTASSIPGVTFEWFNDAGMLIGTGDSNPVTPFVPSCFYVIGTDPLNCQVSDTVCLTPVFFDLDITADQGICAGDQATICVTDQNEQNLSYVWFPNGQTTPCITVQPSETTTYSVVVTNEDLGCKENLSSTVEVFVFDPPVIIITADPDSIVIGEPVQLGTNQNNPEDYEYEWSSSTGDPIEPIPNPVVTPVVATTYSVTVTDEHGCTGTASLTVPVITPECNEEEIFLPNAFSPNGDDENDILYLRGNYILTMEIHIYNRWGEEVFTSNDINVGWDGTYKGKNLEPDVFGYYLNVGCPGNKSYFEKGNITLLH